MKSMNVKEIIIAKLKELGADGLCSEDCGCSIDDFCPCGEDCLDCVPAKKVKCVACSVDNFVPMIERFDSQIKVTNLAGETIKFICNIEDRNITRHGTEKSSESIKDKLFRNFPDYERILYMEALGTIYSVPFDHVKERTYAHEVLRRIINTKNVPIGLHSIIEITRTTKETLDEIQKKTN